MTEVILHIGPHKTGTSAIQSYLDRHHERLLTAGVDFPKLGRAEQGFPSHRYFAALFRMAPNEPPPPGFAARVAQGISPAPLAILSSEDFYFCSTPIAMKRVRRRIGVPRQIVAYLRHPSGHLLSLWREGLKQTLATPFGSFCEGHLRALSDPDRFAYFRLEANLAVWERLHPVTVVPFGGTDLVGGFFRACGLSELYQRDENETENAGAGDSVVACQLIVNQALAQGRIDRERHRWFRGRLRNPQAIAALHPIEDRILRREEDLTAFLRGCRTHNPAFARDWEGSAEVLTIPYGLENVGLKDLSALLQPVGRRSSLPSTETT